MTLTQITHAQRLLLSWPRKKHKQLYHKTAAAQPYCLCKLQARLLNWYSYCLCWDDIWKTTSWLRRNCFTLRHWKTQLSIPFPDLMTTAVSLLKLLLKYSNWSEQLQACNGKISPSSPSTLPSPFSLRFPSTPPSSLDYITLVCEHSSQHSFSSLTLATLTPRPPQILYFPLAEWCFSLLGIGWIIRHLRAVACQPMWTFCPTDTLSHCSRRGRQARSRLWAEQF